MKILNDSLFKNVNIAKIVLEFLHLIFTAYDHSDSIISLEYYDGSYFTKIFEDFRRLKSEIQGGLSVLRSRSDSQISHLQITLSRTYTPMSKGLGRK